MQIVSYFLYSLKLQENVKELKFSWRDKLSYLSKLQSLLLTLQKFIFIYNCISWFIRAIHKKNIIIRRHSFNPRYGSLQRTSDSSMSYSPFIPRLIHKTQYNAALRTRSSNWKSKSRTGSSSRLTWYLDSNLSRHFHKSELMLPFFCLFSLYN